MRSIPRSNEYAKSPLTKLLQQIRECLIWQITCLVALFSGLAGGQYGCLLGKVCTALWLRRFARNCAVTAMLDVDGDMIILAVVGEDWENKKSEPKSALKAPIVLAYKSTCKTNYNSQGCHHQSLR